MTAGGNVPSLPQPVLPSLRAQGAYGIVITGVGGTGVVTIGQLLGMAAHLEGKGLSVLDMAGLAQKGGAVFSHVQIAPRPEDLYANRIAMGDADVVLGCDLIVTTSNEALSKIRAGVTKAVVNTTESPTADFVRNPNWQFGTPTLATQVREAIGDGECAFVDANALATALMGDAIYTNPLMLGYAWQKGWIPLAYETLQRAIEINAIAVDANKKAFEWGRAAAHDVEMVKRIAFPDNVVELKRVANTLDEIVAKRVEFLTGYQNGAYAKRYADLVERVRKVESDRLQSTRVTEAVARYYFKLLAYKDEYEVARLHSDPAFRAKIAAQFDGLSGKPYKLNFYMAPPIVSKPDPVTGKVAKKRFGPWMMPAFSLLARLKFLRGSAFDVFGYTAERRTERGLIGEYEATIEEILARLSSDNHELAAQLASIPDDIRGYGYIKEGNLKVARIKWDELLGRLRGQVKAQVIKIAPKAA